MRTYQARITPKGRTISYEVVVQARNLDEARKILKLQYENCSISTLREVR